MPGAGFEPARAEAQWILNPSRKPVPPPRLLFQFTRQQGSDVPSTFRTDQAIQGRDVRPSRHRYDYGIRLPPCQADPVESGREDGPDVLAAIAELVARVYMSLHSVQRPTAVGMNQAPDEVFRITLHNAPLPRSEGNPSLMLQSGPVLWKQAGPMLPVRIHLDCPVVVASPGGPAPGTHRRDSAATLIHDLLVPLVLKDTESVDATLHFNDMSIT